MESITHKIIWQMGQQSTNAHIYKIPMSEFNECMNSEIEKAFIVYAKELS